MGEELKHAGADCFRCRCMIGERVTWRLILQLASIAHMAQQLNQHFRPENGKATALALLYYCESLSPGWRWRRQAAGPSSG